MRPPGPRMRCERYRADISVATCLARQKAAAAAGERWAYFGAQCDPGCVRCPQGLAAKGEAYVPAPPRTAPAAVDPRGVAESKRCRCCGERKPADGFYRDARLRDGLTSWCRACVRAGVVARRGARGDKAKKGGG
jgi:hypothetical protein